MINKHILSSMLLILLISISIWNCNQIKLEIEEKKPNIILFLIDDLGWKDVGYMGSKFYETPNIDELAKQGMIFTNAYSNAPNCAPSRASLLTGKYSPQHKIYTVGTSERGRTDRRKLIPIKNNITLDPDHITIAEILSKNDYRCISIGKWHLGSLPEYGPTAQGFDYNLAGNHTGHPESYFSPYKNKNLTDGINKEHLPERLTSEAIKFITDNKTNPFFLYLPFYSVHTPLQAKQNIIDKYRKKEKDEFHNNPTYAAMIESVDDGIGRILKHLANLNLDDNTIVIFLSDNGGHGEVTSMSPLRGSKGMLYEGGIRVPMIVKWTNRIKQNSVCDTNVIGSDLLPTILSLTGVSTQEDLLIDGENLSSLFFKDGNFFREAIYWHFPAYLEGKARGARDEYFRTRPGSAIKMGDWKLIEYFEDSHLELYNLKEDIEENKNLADIRPDKKKQLYNKLVEWRKSLKAPIPKKLNPYFKANN